MMTDEETLEDFRENFFNEAKWLRATLSPYIEMMHRHPTVVSFIMGSRGTYEGSHDEERFLLDKEPE